MPKPDDNPSFWTERKKKTVKRKAMEKDASELTLVELALMGNWSDDHNACAILYGMLRSALEHLESGSIKTAKEILEKLISWGF